MPRGRILAALGRRASMLLLLAAVVVSIIGMLLLSQLGGNISGGAEPAPPEVDALKDATAQAAKFLSSLHSELLVYDRVLQMQVARGALSSEQAAAQLQQRAEDLASGIVDPATQTEEERQEASSFFDAIEQAAANSPAWPSAQTPDYYSALVSVILERVRAEYATALAAGKDTSQSLDDAYRGLALTRGEETPSASPFSDPDARVFAAVDVPESATPPTDVPEAAATPPVDVPEAPATPPVAAPPGALEFGVDRPGQDIATYDLGEGDTPNVCAILCDRSADCRAFTFVQAGVQGPNPRCWLKNTVPDPRQDACCISGVKAASE
jgi:PAN domain-containing protein